MDNAVLQLVTKNFAAVKVKEKCFLKPSTARTYRIWQLIVCKKGGTIVTDDISLVFHDRVDGEIRNEEA